MSIGIFEFDKLGNVPFGAPFLGSAPPIDAFGRQLGLPLGKPLRIARVEHHVIQNRLRSCARRDAVVILIRPHIC